MDRRLRDHLHPLTGSGHRRVPRLGNPLQSEQAAFRWVVAVIIGAIVVIALAELISSAVGFVAAILLGGFVAVIAGRGAWRMINGEDEFREPGEGEGDPPERSGEG